MKAERWRTVMVLVGGVVLLQALSLHYRIDHEALKYAYFAVGSIGGFALRPEIDLLRKWRREHYER